MEDVKVDATEMISAVKAGKEFFLYTCMIKADYLKLKNFLRSERRFKGMIKNEYGETPVEFILKPNDRYRKKAEEFYEIAALNYLPCDWQFYEFASAPDSANYENPPLTNEQDETFSRNLIEYYGQRIKTHTEMMRFFKSFKVSEYLTFVGAKIIDKVTKRETYSTEEFID